LSERVNERPTDGLAQGVSEWQNEWATGILIDWCSDRFEIYEGTSGHQIIRFSEQHIITQWIWVRINWWCAANQVTNSFTKHDFRRIKILEYHQDILKISMVAMRWQVRRTIGMMIWIDFQILKFRILLFRICNFGFEFKSKSKPLQCQWLFNFIEIKLNLLKTNQITYFHVASNQNECYCYSWSNHQTNSTSEVRKDGGTSWAVRIKVNGFDLIQETQIAA
jgi:hypothetical protein